MEWIIWVRLGIELLKLMQAKNKGEQISLDELVGVLTSLGVKDKDIAEIKKMLPDVGLIIQDITKLIEKGK
jgi:hypothetical protein